MSHVEVNTTVAPSELQLPCCSRFPPDRGLQSGSRGRVSPSGFQDDCLEIFYHRCVLHKCEIYLSY